jgi:putative FmdB family regulatory protein
MPTYEYLCESCENEFETEQRISDPPKATCPACGSAGTHRLISHSSFVLKGSGWYVTDYARKGGNGSGHDKPSKPSNDDSTAKASEPATPATPAAPAAPDKPAEKPADKPAADKPAAP